MLLIFLSHTNSFMMHQSADLHVKTRRKEDDVKFFSDFLAESGCCDCCEGAGLCLDYSCLVLEGGAGGSVPFVTPFISKGPGGCRSSLLWAVESLVIR